MSVPTLAGITAKTIATERITTRVLFSGPEDGLAVLFLHGNASSATWWEETLVALPPQFRGIAPDQRGFGDADPDKKVDATRGAGDWADDAVALLDTLGIDKAHVVGNSLGGVVVWRLLADFPQRLLTATLVDTGSPFGFGGTKDVDGTPCYDDFAGSGGGLSNPELIKRLAEQDRSMDSRFSPRLALRTLLVKPPFIPAREEDLLSSMFTTHLGPQDNPGDFLPSPNWPYVAPGRMGRGQCAVAEIRRRCPQDDKRRAQGDGSSGCAAATTWPYPMRRFPAPARWDRWAPSQAGRGWTFTRRSRCSARHAPCWRSTPRLAAGTRRW